jgi:hypothetical protein
MGVALKEMGRDDDVETDQMLIKDAKFGMLKNLRDAIDRYTKEKELFSDVQRCIRNAREDYLYVLGRQPAIDHINKNPQEKYQN